MDSMQLPDLANDSSAIRDLETALEREFQLLSETDLDEHPEVFDRIHQHLRGALQTSNQAERV